VLWLLGSALVAYWLTRRPHAVFAEPAPRIDWGVIESLRLATADGEELGAWFIPGKPEQPLVLLLHGNRGCRHNCLKQAELLAQAGCSMLLISLRAHGDSTGDRNDIGFSARHDVAAAVSWLEQRHPNRPIVIWGRSLGAGAALFAAGDLKERVSGYILECPFQDLRTAAWNRTQHFLPPVASGIAYLGLEIVAPVVVPEVDEISPLKAAAGVPATVPVLILCGSADWRARPDESRAIYACVQAHAELVVIEGGEHLQLFQKAPDECASAVFRLVEKSAVCRK
jgi:alpha-beta hydrolase superfamily lysophospholipase